MPGGLAPYLNVSCLIDRKGTFTCHNIYMDEKFCILKLNLHGFVPVVREQQALFRLEL